MKKKSLMYFLAICVVPILALFFLEVLFTTAYLFSKSKYFENKIESYLRVNVLQYENIKDSEIIFSNEKPIKIAIFGGSSAAGAFSSINFFQLIKSNVFTKKNIIVHNYSKPAEPFVDFQAEILKAVMPYYDVLIIYTGHNEIHQILRSSVKYLSEPRILPSGYTIEHGLSPYEKINKRIEDITKYGLHGYIKPSRINLGFITERSRLSLFSYRVIDKIYQKILKFNNKNKNINLNDINKNDMNHIFGYYYSEKFITSDERKNIVNDYKKIIFDIIERLDPNQKLILSTVLSDNLFPPFADVIDNHDLGQFENYEKYAKKSYEALLNDDYSSLDFFVKKIPPGANKSYLQAENCLGLVWGNKLNNSNCLDLFQEARKLDDFPLRVVPEINAFIKELKFNNVIIIDPVKILNNSDNFINYKNHFADFQHPSTLGHYLIANEILIELFDDYSAPLSFSLNECDHLAIQKKFKKFIIKPNNSTQRWNIKHSIKWLDNFINKQPGYRDFYNYYKDKTINKRDFCDIKY